MHDQSLEVVTRQLRSVLSSSDLEIGDVGTWSPRVKDEVVQWLSDWHLVTFLCMQGLFSLVSQHQTSVMGTADEQEEQKLLCRIATAHTRPKETYNIDRLFASSGWQTLLTIAESSAAAESSRTGGNATPSAAFDAMGIDSPGAGASGGGGDAGGPRTCPHCTFVNEAGGPDCEICGLPLAG